MTFFRTIAQSIYGPSFYQTLETKTMWQSIRYFVALSLIAAAVLSIVFIPSIFGFFSTKTVDEVVNAYPADLEVRVENGQASTNQPEPYFIPNPEAGDTRQNIVVIDTQNTFTPELLSEYSTYVWITKTHAVAVEESGEVRMIPLTDVGNITLSRDVVAGWGAATYPYLPVVATIVTLLAVVFGTLLQLRALIYLLLAALVVLGIGKLMKYQFGYGHAYKIALHAATLPLLVSLAVRAFGFSMPFLTFSLLLVFVVILNLRRTSATPVADAA